MNFYGTVFLLLLFSFHSCSTCNDFYQNEYGCISSIGIQCKWNSKANQCVESTGKILGCLANLNKQSCISQISYPDKSIAECIFSGYCRDALFIGDTCNENLSRSGCLAVKNNYCQWKEKCTTLSENQVQILLEETDLTDDLKYSSVNVCQRITQFPVIHQRGALKYLKTLFLNSLVTQVKTNYYSDLLEIPGCLKMIPEIIVDINCDADGLNIQSCMQVQNQYCIFQDGECQTINNFSNLKCSDNVNKEACLSITTILETCHWDNDICALFKITSQSSCKTGIQVSPSVCALIQSEECFYDEQTKMCSQKCRASEYQGSANKAVCQESSYDCTFDEESEQCVFKSNQCDKLGQNLQACQNVDQYCQFINGFCKSIENLILMGCQSGLNRLACINLTTPSQICKFQENQCLKIDISFDESCETLVDVNQNACKKVTNDGCYWEKGSCQKATGSQECSTPGFNKIACLSTKSSITPCFWNGESGSCKSLSITAESTCESLKMVNAIACKSISQGLCKYNSVLYQCELFVMSSSIKCITEGLNADACRAITDQTQSCRWQSNTCQQITQLESTVLCQSLQLVTSKTCALLQNSSQKCVYDPITQSCITNVTSSIGCEVAGLNPIGCSFQNSQCFFDTSTNQCKKPSALDLNKISCDSDYASKSTCFSITTGSQYCKWVTKTNSCVQQKFPVSNYCDENQLVSKQFCLAYLISPIQDWSNRYYCTYNQDKNSCEIPQFQVTGCGTDKDINSHACVGMSDKAQSCYFDYDMLKCVEITDPLRLSTLLCVFAKKKVCSQISTINQYCLWHDSQSKCEPVLYMWQCADFTNDTSRQSNKNLCAFTYGSACQYDETALLCKLVDDGVTDLSCADNGLNETACLNNTSQACYYDPKKYLCFEVAGAAVLSVNCSSKVNQRGCFASLFEFCSWDTDKQNCFQLTNSNFGTVQCGESNDQLYKHIIFGQITATGEFCEYDAVNNVCRSLEDGTIMYDCQSGYDEYTCNSYIDCKQWVYNSDTNSYESYLCNNLTTKSVCSVWISEADCLSAQYELCGWISGVCVLAQIRSDSSCDEFTVSTGKFTVQVCQYLNKPDDYCQYDETNQACQVVTADDNNCDVLGLNQNACLAKTNGKTCQFLNDLTSDNYGCLILSDFSNATCGSLYNKDSCVKTSSSLCYFDLMNNICNKTDQYTLYQNKKCSDFNDTNKFIVTESICKFLGGSSGCKYDSTHKICKITTSLLPLCSSNSTINISFCQNQISNEICYFDWYQNQCMVFDTTTADCKQCQSYKQCVNSQVSACSWVGSSCVSSTLGSSCTSLTNINSLTCMQFLNNNDKCQFKNSGASTSCIVPPNDNQPCDGLNKAACIANTSNSCYYYNKKCIDISSSPFQAICTTTDYSFNQNGCIRIKTPKQFCQWVNGQCQAIKLNSNATCTQYATSTYSSLVCASVQTGNCIWNNGCVVGTAANCEALGANKGACINAASGNCVFSQGVCQEATNASPYVQINCNDPSNKGGCLNINNGLACKWTGTSCDYQAVTAGCATYSNVNPGVCAKTTDIACTWINNACQAATVQGNCTDKGLNELACLGYTANFCYYDIALHLCKSINTYDDLKKMSCDDKLNQSACLNHPNKCCYWDSQNQICSGISPGSVCEALTNTSNYCCQHVVGDQCTYPYCSQLMKDNVNCLDALNQDGCNYVYDSCRWIEQDSICINVPNTYGCKIGMNWVACVTQTVHCKFIDNQLKDSCLDLSVSSLSEIKCHLTEKDRCQEAEYSGCLVPAINVECISKLNFLACIDNTNFCQWNKTTKQCSKISSVAKPQTCPTGFISRGYCSFASVLCKLDMTTYICSSLQNTDSCDQKTSVATKNSSVCLTNIVDLCQYDPIRLQCTSQIFGSICTTQVTYNGCKLIENYCNWTDNSCQYNDPDQIFYTCHQTSLSQKCKYCLYLEFR